MDSFDTPAGKKIKTRFAPSPTGALHIGGVRTALFSWLYARQNGGEFILRIEDTDRQRSSDESARGILEGFEWLGLDYDGEVVYQTQRLERYHEVAQTLLDGGYAYYCHCSPEELKAMRDEQIRKGQTPQYDGRCRTHDGQGKRADPAVRFMNPSNGAVEFFDTVYGSIRISNEVLDDMVMIRSDGMPTYNFSVVVDDMDMGITHIIRGEDHLSNTAKQINLWRAIKKTYADTPEFVHIPMILDPDGKRLSKRSGATGLDAYKAEGYLPDALLNYLVRLGWSYGDQEVFTRDEMVEKFNLDNISQASASIDPKKLRWLNKHHMQMMPPAKLCPLFEPYLKAAGIDETPSQEVVAALCSRYDTLKEMAEGAHFFYAHPEYAPGELETHVDNDLLQAIATAVGALDEWSEASLKQALGELAEARGVKFGKIGAPLRYVLTAGAASPGIAETACLIGREACLSRIDRALRRLAESVS